MKFKYDKVKEKLIVQDSTRIEYNQLQVWLKRHTANYKYNPKYKMGYWDGTIDYFKDGNINQGLWKECLKGCNEIGAKFEIINKKDFPLNRDVTFDGVNSFCDEFFKNHKVKDKETGELIPFFPYDYQIETAYKILKNRYCLASVATSGGKTLINSIVFFYILSNIDPDAKILLIVPSITLVSQFYDDIVEYNEGMLGKSDNKVDLRIQEIMSDKPRTHSGQEHPNLYISTYQSLAKVENWGKKFYHQFHTVAVDEGHKSKSASFIKILEQTVGHAYYRFGMSGTFPDEMSCESLSVQSLLGPQVTNIEAKDLQKSGKIAPLKIKCIYLNHQDAEFDQQLGYIRSNPALGAKAYRLEQKYIQQSEPRMKFISKLVGKTKGNTLVLFNIIEHGKKILEKLEADHPDLEFLYIDGSVKKKLREEYKAKMELNDGVRRILVASYGTLSTGVSINNIMNIIFGDSFKSESLIIQSIGRGLRLHEDKSICMIYDLIDCFKESNQKNSFYRHGSERQILYRKYEYPYEKMKFLL